MIEKKREMFLIKMLISTKKNEQTKLQDFTTMRLDGLNLTEKMLAEDIKNFIEFFKTNSDGAQKAQNEAESQVKIRSQKAITLNESKKKCQDVMQNMSKNIEVLKELDKYRRFLL